MRKESEMKTLILTTAAALVLGGATATLAQKPDSDTKTPPGWSYDVKNGERVPRGKRQVNADGSWKEEIRNGDCVTVRQKTSSGEYRETREC
jgi:hypothetical protein